MNGPLKARSTYVPITERSLVQDTAAAAYAEAIADAATIIRTRSGLMTSYQLGEIRALTNVLKALELLPNPYLTVDDAS